tara:strand:+ start:3430 stop:4764 length:1335 start_codon:yes stop_codon:yes gene_type:complete
MIDVIKPLIKQFLPFAQERMGFQKPPRLFVRQDEQNAQNPLGKTAYYDPQAKSVTLYVTGRHPKDVMRSLSHELVHHTQNCNGQFENVGEMGEGYAQNDSHLREMERQAYEIGNLCFRDWEDSIKQTIYFEHLQKGVEKVMSTKDWKNGEMNTLLTEKWGFTFNLDRLNERTGDEVDPKRAKSAVDKGKDDDTVETDDLEQTTEGLDEMGGCADHDGEEVVVMGDGEPGDEGPEDPQGLVDELGELVSRLQSALGGGMGGEDEMVVDIQERLRTVLKTIAEGQGEKDRDDESESAEHGKIADKDFKGSKKKKQKSRRDDTLGDRGGRTKLKGRMAGITEDSEDQEDEHYEKNVGADEKHYGSDEERVDRMEELARELQGHIDSLRGDERGLDHDEGYDEEHIEEGGAADKKDPRNRRQTERSRPMQEAQLRAMIRQALKKSLSK